MTWNNRGFLSVACFSCIVSAFAIQERGDTLRRARVAEAKEAAAYLRRDVVDEFGIDTAEMIGSVLRITGYLHKRACPLNSDDPYAVVDFWEEKPSGRRSRLNFAFGALPEDFEPRPRSRTSSRPQGSTDYVGWEIQLNDPSNTDAVVVAFAQHNCGVDAFGVPVIVGPREFLRVTVAEALAGGFVWRSTGAE